MDLVTGKSISIYGLDIDLFIDYKKKGERCYIRKEINLTLIDKDLYETLHHIALVDNCKERIYCRMSVIVYMHYGLKDLLFTLMPVLRRIRKKWLRKRWSQTLGCLGFPIDTQKLGTLLEQGKQILDNFDESWLKEIKLEKGVPKDSV